MITKIKELLNKIIKNTNLPNINHNGVIFKFSDIGRNTITYKANVNLMGREVPITFWGKIDTQKIDKEVLYDGLKHFDYLIENFEKIYKEVENKIVNDLGNGVQEWVNEGTFDLENGKSTEETFRELLSLDEIEIRFDEPEDTEEMLYAFYFNDCDSRFTKHWIHGIEIEMTRNKELDDALFQT